MGVIQIFGVVHESPRSRCLSLLIDYQGSLGQPGSAVGAADVSTSMRCIWAGMLVQKTAQLVCRKASKMNVNVYRNKQRCYRLHCFGFSSPRFACLVIFNWSGIKLLHLQDWSLDIHRLGNLSGCVKNHLPRKKNYIIFIPKHLVYAGTDPRPSSTDMESLTCLLC